MPLRHQPAPLHELDRREELERRTNDKLLGHMAARTIAEELGKLEELSQE